MMNLIRKIISIVLLLPLLIFLSVAYDYFIAHDFFGLILAIVISTALAILIYKIWPKKKVTNDFEFQAKPEPISSEAKLDSSEEGTPVNDVEEYTATINDIESIELEVEEITPPTIEDKPMIEKVDQRKKINIHTYVTGLKYEGRTTLLKDYIKEMIESGMIEPYGGRKSSEIKDELMYTDDVIWEVEEEVIPYITVIDEPDNEFDSEAMAVYLYDDKIGYVPKDCLNRIKDLRVNAELTGAIAIIKGGKYKYVDDEEKLRTKTKTYHLDLVISFRK